MSESLKSIKERVDVLTDDQRSGKSINKKSITKSLGENKINKWVKEKKGAGKMKSESKVK